MHRSSRWQQQYVVLRRCGETLREGRGCVLQIGIGFSGYSINGGLCLVLRVSRTTCVISKYTSTSSAGLGRLPRLQEHDKLGQQHHSRLWLLLPWYFVGCGVAFYLAAFGSRRGRRTTRETAHNQRRNTLRGFFLCARPIPGTHSPNE